jgi:IS5 family transposase
MSHVRFREGTTNSFFGDFLYESVVPKTHFLYRLRQEIPWGTIVAPILTAYKGGAEFGPSPYHPEKLLRMLLVAYLFGISERRCEEMVNDTLSAKYFVGLGVDESAPDHSTLTVFKTRITEKLGVGIWDKLFQKTIRIAKRKKIVFGALQLIDSTHTTADVNEEADHKRQTKEDKPPRDPDATHKVKKQKEAINTQGKKIKINDYIYGYKAHTSMNRRSRLITSVKATTAKDDDGIHFIALVKKDQRLGVVKSAQKEPKDNTGYSADKGYDQGDNHYYLEEHKLFNAIILKANRLQEKWQTMKEDPNYQKVIKFRKQIENKFGEEKLHHRFGRCRYLGLRRYKIQAYMTAMAVNLKRILLLTDPNYSPPKPSLCLSI